VESAWVVMKRKSLEKPLIKTEIVVPAEILEQAKQSISPDRLRKAAKCSVCNADTTVLAASEPLCWVCRRLKISAWKEIEQQAPIQE
jgi:hypothetical protein